MFQPVYIYGNYIDGILRITNKTGTNNGNYYYLHDHLYTTVALVNSSGTVVERYEYDVYGKCRIMDASYNSRSTSNYENCYLFTGRRLDILDINGSLKIQYNRNRYYDPETGRWLTHDPLGITPNPPKPNFFDAASQYIDGMNLYEYVGSAAPMALDAAGLRWFCRDKCKLGDWSYKHKGKPVMVVFPGTPEQAEVAGQVFLGGKIVGWGIWALHGFTLPCLCPTVDVLKGESLPETAQRGIVNLVGGIQGWRLFLKVQVKYCCQVSCDSCWTSKLWKNVWKKKTVAFECVGNDPEPNWTPNPTFGEPSVGPPYSEAPGRWGGTKKQREAKAKACKEELDKALRTAMSAKKGASSTDEICVIKTDKCKAKKD